MRFEKNARLFLVVFLCSLLLMPLCPLPVQAVSQNPSPQEISAIFDRVAIQEQVPAEILKAIAYGESGWRQWDSNGKVVIGGSGSRPYIGIMQVGVYDPSDTATINRLKTDIAFNIAYGAQVLKSKWNMTPVIGDGDPGKLENWYFAIWAYNSWSTRNNPNNAAAAGRIAYQDKILALMAKDYYYGIVQPVKVTPISKSLLPAGTLPSKDSVWLTPQPVHTAGFTLGMLSLLSRGEKTSLLSSVDRISGIDRIDTAVQIAYNGWSAGCDAVLIARSDAFADALAGVSLAKLNNAPILLTYHDELDSRVAEAITVLKPLKVIILGGENALSAQVESALKDTVSWTEDIVRIAGTDRYDTAAQIAAQFPEGSGVAIANGVNFADALAIASAAAVKGYPLLLTSENNFPQATIESLTKHKPSAVYIAGGIRAVPADQANAVTILTGLGQEQIQRFAGSDRYATSLAVVQTLYPDAVKLYLATGAGFPDALAGAALAANTDTPLLLIPTDGPVTGSKTEKYFQTISPTTELSVFGGRTVITDNAIIRIRYQMTNQ
ncbi:cell wall-binding repeat-containing protein [Dehalobacter sp. DCM]|uniref:cell wall-binding repeat-containing protein n=1 Tax=Dehalobacter sp. DCM TaxID=2907827 RepID=UPI00308180C5|nr:cell wall-binding repeat-containing protein [Dehalobacter sp. DCM]